MDEKCRYCGCKMSNMVADLGMQPLSNDYTNEYRIKMGGQITLSLKAFVCDECKLVQVTESKMPEEVFNSEYPYFSSYSTTWLKHSKKYVDMIVKELNLNGESSVIEIASNDGYLLQYFPEYGITPLGIEPTKSTAEVAKKKGIETIEEFFSESLAKKLSAERGKADLIIGNNVLAHVPDIRDFVKGLQILVTEKGTVTLEFPHLLNLIKYNQFDTIYHEHYSYLSIITVNRIFRENGLKVYRIEKLSTHGGSLRIYATHENNEDLPVEESVSDIINEEKEFGLDDISTYTRFNERVKKLKWDILETISQIRKEHKTIVGYGAAAKGNTLLNYCGIGRETIEFIADASPHKQGMLTPGSIIPIVSPEVLKEKKPDYVLIIPWNLKSEIMNQLSFIRDYGGKFLTFIPRVEIC